MWLWFVACSVEKPPLPSLVLITLDTTRADRIATYGYDKGYTPNLTKLAAEGARFDAAYTTSPMTVPAHASIMTGRYPPGTGVRVNGDHPLPEELMTLAEHLDAAGYQTVASLGAFVTTRLFNFDQGFDAFNDDMPLSVGTSVVSLARWSLERPASAVIQDLQEALLELDPEKPVFLWAHLYDPHEPWTAPGIFMTRGADGYDSEISFADAQMGRLRTLATKTLGDRIAWVVVSDHGEGLAGDKEHGHGMYLFEPTTRVPFIIRGPDPVAEGVAVSTPVSIVDVLPTALGLVGLPIPDGLDGVDLSSALNGKPVSRGPVYMESETPRVRFGWAPEVAVIDSRFKVYDTPTPRLYAKDDIAEQNDLMASRGAEAQDLIAFAREVRAQQPVGSAPDLGGLTAQLEALGYVGADSHASAQAIDVKDRIDRVVALDLAKSAARNPETRIQAYATWRKLLEEDPELIEARLGVVAVLTSAGKQDEGLALLDEGLVLRPDAAPLRVNRGRLLMTMARTEEAAAEAKRILETEPANRTARDLLVSTTVPLDASLALVREWQKATADDPFLHAKAGQILLMLGRLDEAAPELQLAVEAIVPWIGAHRAMASVEAQKGNTNKALYHLQLEVANYPEDPLSWRALGEHLLNTKPGEALPALTRAMAMNPVDPVARAWLAEAYLKVGDLKTAETTLAPVLPSEDPRVLIVYANVLRASGQIAKAEAVFQKAKARMAP